MNDEAKSLLSQLMKAKELVKKLEAEYRKVCSCNEKNPAAPEDNKYTFTTYASKYKQCEYHKTRVVHNYAKI